ncbi:uncharacterized protein LOC135924046 [Gordionus sp. m RMFG-2023]|uniref:uncharacterized protein LOC135924046 n=1 Tax=Gordionus sp. m RMFG-2023 TaxID=3053472 RepID=UPI0031FC5B5B
MKARAFPQSDAQCVDLHPAKSKTRELASMLNKRKVDIACIQETKWRGQKTLIIIDGYKLYYNGILSNRNVVCIILSQDLTSSDVEINKISDREEEKDDFRAILDEAVMEIPKDDLIILDGDLNAHVGKARNSYKRHHGGFGYGERKDEGEYVLKFAQAFDLALNNTYFRKKESHLITYESGARKTQIDYMLISRRRLKDVIDCKVIPVEDIAAQYHGFTPYKELWWWNEDVQTTIKEKKALLWYKSKNPYDKTNYKKSKRIATKAVARAKAMHMKNNKARGPDDIPIENLKALGDDAIHLTNLYNKILGNE